ncbi:MAG: hypothetical protein HYV60_18180, partial [Planctomycetia bacterium]|nr:hypothetical protein [Planctomycetia bacterium]
TPSAAQFLGELAPNEKSGDERRRLGFEVHGNISFDNPSDVDVYSFQALGGTEVWIDVDRTNPALDTIIELITAQGVALAQSLASNDNSTLSGLALPMIKDVHDGIDYFGTNPRDAGMRVVLPGSSSLNSYFLRIRSQPAPGQIFNITAGETVGDYQFQIRLRHDDESPGSTVRFADVRFAATGIEIAGLPAHSPLLGESAEANDAANNTVAGAQDLGNLLTSDRNTISVGADLSSSADVDFFQFGVNYDRIQSIAGVNSGGKSFSTIFDVDYADGLARPDSLLSVFDSNGRLVLIGRDSNIADDQPKPAQGTNVDDLSRGSVGKLDPYVGTVQLPAGSVPAGTNVTYTVGVSSNRALPAVLDGTFNSTATSPNTRLEPVNSVQRIVEDHIGFSGYTTSLDANGQPVVVLPQQQAPILDIHSIAALETSVRPLSLGDIQLFVSSGNSVSTINPQTGQLVIPNLVGGASIQDIDLRSDGRLFAYTSGRAAQANEAGFVDELDIGTVPLGGQNDGSDLVPDAVVTTNNVDAMTFRVVGRSGGTTAAVPAVNYDVYYSVRDGNQSHLFVADDVGLAPVDIGLVNGVAGLVTGLEFVGNTLFGVTNAGNFTRFFPGTVNNPGSGNASSVVDFSSFTGGRSVPFSGLTIGPQNLENGAYANMLFGVTNNGWLYAMDQTGTPLSVFTPNADTNNDGILNAADGFGIELRNGTVILAGASGLAFSTMDFNLWHPTARRGQIDQPGHGVNDLFDGTRETTFVRNNVGLPNTGEFRPQQEGQGGASFYFGLDQLIAGSQFTNYRYSGNQQFGAVGAFTQFDLSSNDSIRNTYNLPGGSQGSLVTNSFSLQSYSRTDKPTLYFNYFLDTEGADSQNAMRDSARVFASRDGGATWELLATNNSVRSNGASGNAELPSFASTSRDAWSASPNQDVQELFETREWRQARVDLADFAGEDTITLRFDFSTAGSMNDPSLPAVAQSGVGLNSPLRAASNQNEGFYIDDIIVGFAERGEMVANAPADQTGFFTVPRDASATQEILFGPYQFEIRRGFEIISSNSGELGNPITPLSSQTKITQVFDTNDRLADGRTLFIPDGGSIIDGQSFTISDGITSKTFEFDTDAVENITSGRIRVTVVGTELRAGLAQFVASLINTAPNFKVTAITQAADAKSGRVDLVGATNLALTGMSAAELSVSIADAVIHEDDPSTLGAPDPTSTIATFRRTGDLSGPLTVAISAISAASGALRLPSTDVVLADPNTNLPISTVTFAAGASTVDVKVIAVDEALGSEVADGRQTVILTATHASFTSLSDTVDVTDNETPELKVTIVSPGGAGVSESADVNAAQVTVARNTPLNAPLDVTIISHDVSELSFSDPLNAAITNLKQITVTIPAGQAGITVGVNAVDDTISEPTDQIVSISAHTSTYLSDSATLAVLDANDLSIEIAGPNQIPEGMATTGIVRRGPGDLSQAVTVQITSSNPTTGATVTSPVTIPVGAEISNAFTITGRLDNVPDGNQLVTITATEVLPPNAGRLPATTTATITVMDVNTPTLSVTILPITVSEAYTNHQDGETGRVNSPATWIRVARSGDLSNSVTLGLQLTDTSALTTPTFGMTIPAGRSFVDVPLSTVNNFTNAAANSMNPINAIGVTVDDGPGGFLPASSTINIQDNEDMFILFLDRDVVDESTLQGQRITFPVQARRPFAYESGGTTITANPGGRTTGDVCTDTNVSCVAGGGVSFTGTATTASRDFYTIVPDPVMKGERVVFTASPGTGMNTLYVRDVVGPNAGVLDVSLVGLGVIPESGGTTIMQVTRPANGAINPLNVSISTSDPNEALILAPGSTTPTATATIFFGSNVTTVQFTVIGVHDTDAPTDPITGLRQTWVDADYDLDGDNSQLVTITAQSPGFSRGAGRVLVSDVDKNNPDIRLSIYRRNPDGTRGA